MAIQAGLVLPTKLSDEWVKGIAEAKLLQREYRFQHDKIQQSCYDIKPPEESKQIHLRIARDWYRIYRDNVSPFRLMAIADQFNKGLNYVADGTEKKLIQSLNDEAGNIALQSAAYEVAYQYHDIAKSLIISNDWRENYETAFKVLLHYIKSSFLSHHYDRSEQASTEALQHANNAFDKAQLVFIKGDLLRIAGKSGVQYYEEAISLVGTPKLIKAHNKFNLLWSLIKFKFIVHHANSQNQEWSRDSTDEQKLMALCTVRLAEEYYYIGDILRWAYVMTNAVNVTYKERLLDYVLRSFFIYGYIWPRSTFSNALCEKGMAFIYKEKNVSMAADVLFAGTSLVFMWHHPLKEAVFHLNYSNEAGEQVGSLEFAALALVYTLLISTTSSLEILLANIEKVKPRVLSISQKAHSRILPLHLSIECLSVSLQAKEKFNDTYILTLSHDLKYPWTEYTFYYQKMFTFAHTLDLFSLKNDISHLWAMLPKINKSNHVLTMLPYNFYLFLLNIILYPTLSKKEKVRSRFKLYSLYHRIKSWVKLCPDNFLPHHLMMRAEYQRLKGHLSKSLILYEKAITAAKEYDNKEIVSLACQRALTACLDANKVEMAKPYADMTLSAYADWGASAVVNLLKQKYHDLLSSSLVLTEKESVALTTEQQQKQEQRERYALDVRSIILASDVISKEIQLQGLLRNVMQLLIENIGATRSALCLMQKGSLWVEGFYDSKDADIKTLTHTHWQDANLSQEVLLTTWRERKEVIMLDVSQETELNISDYFQQAGTKCLIAAPIIRGDHVVGVIYCENNATTNAFTPERIDILRALAIQMAIAVENSRLYTTFEKFVPKPFLHQLGQEFIFDIEQGDSIEKHMNVLFMDIRNFTGFSEQHSAEQTFKFINEYLEHIMPIIHTRHGFIDKFMGDGVMALFPTTSDDALNACIDMQRHIYQFAQENKVFSHLQVGMALHYGPLMLGVVGEKQHIEGTVIGDTVNVTARLESFNKIYGSACLITDNIKKRLLRPDDYQLRHIGQITLLGRKEPTAVWQVLQTIPDEIIRQTFIKQMSLFNDAYHYYLEQQFDTALRHFNQIIKSNPHDQVAQFYSHYCELYKKSPPPQDWHGEIEMTVK